MANPAGVSEGLLKWLDKEDPDRILAVMMPLGHVAALLYLLHLDQELMEGVAIPDPHLDVSGHIIFAVEKALVQAGYGGDPRGPRT